MTAVDRAGGIAIARTLAIEPGTLLMDEPFGALDAQTRHLMPDELIAIWTRSPTTVVFVAHAAREAALPDDRIAVMTARPGRLREVMQTGLERGNGEDRAKSPEYLRLVDDIWDLVGEEAIAADSGHAQ